MGKIAMLTVCASGGLTTGGTILGTLPVGYRPKVDETLSCTATNGSYVNTPAIIKVLATDGTIKLYEIQNSSNARLTINCLFEVGV